MSDLSPRILVEENSCCESDSEQENREKYKSRKRKKDMRQNIHHNNIQQQQSTDDETESQQLNYGDALINSTPVSSTMLVYNQDKMRRRLQFHFMNPIEKWHAKRRYVVYNSFFTRTKKINVRIADFPTNSSFSSLKLFW
jgi:hypothetical protein